MSRIRRGDERTLWFLAGAVTVIAAVLLLGSVSIPDVAGASPAAGPEIAAELRPAAGDFAVTFNESGLPSGTQWSINLNESLGGGQVGPGSSQTSTATSITFEEPNGSYEFLVEPVVGYSTGPEGNVTVAGAPTWFEILFTSNAPPTSGCPIAYFGANNTLFGDCLGDFSADYRAFNTSTGWTFENASFRIGPVAEVTPAGAVVALDQPSYLGAGTATTVATAREVNVTNTISGVATTAVSVNCSNAQSVPGAPLWEPSYVPGAGGADCWARGPTNLGNVTLRIVFHFENGTGTPRLKFDVAIDGWPWVSPDDRLGIVVQMETFALPGGSHFVYTAADDTVTQLWDANDSAIASVAFGPSANTTSGPAEELSVSDQVGLFWNSSVPTMAVALLTFGGPGGYGNLSYDPWVDFGVSGIPTTLPIPPLPVNGAALPLLAVGGIALGALALGVVAYRARRHPIEQGLLPFA